MQTINISNNISDIKLIPIDKVHYALVVNSIDTATRFTKHSTFSEVQQAITSYYLGN